MGFKFQVLALVWMSFNTMLPWTVAHSKSKLSHVNLGLTVCESMIKTLIDLEGQYIIYKSYSCSKVSFEILKVNLHSKESELYRRDLSILQVCFSNFELHNGSIKEDFTLHLYWVDKLWTLGCVFRIGDPLF